MYRVDLASIYVEDAGQCGDGELSRYPDKRWISWFFLTFAIVWVLVRVVLSYLDGKGFPWSGIAGGLTGIGIAYLVMVWMSRRR